MLLSNIFSKQREKTSGEKVVESLLSKDYRDLKDEMENRGLSFGDLHVKEFECFGNRDYRLELDVLGEKGYSISKDHKASLRRSVQQAMEDKGLVNNEDYTIDRGFYGHSLEVYLTRSGEDKISGTQQRKAIANKLCYKKLIVEISDICTGYALGFKVRSSKGLDMAFAIANKLGLKTGDEPCFAYESTIPLSQILDACIYRDCRAEKNYFQIIFSPNLIKHWLLRGGGGSNFRKYKDSGREIFINVTEEMTAKFNNQDVNFIEVKQPTDWMIKTRDNILERIKESIREREENKPKCSFEGGCREEAISRLFEPTSIVEGFYGRRKEGVSSDFCRKHIEAARREAKKRLDGSGLEEEIDISEIEADETLQSLKERLREW